MDPSEMIEAAARGATKGASRTVVATTRAGGLVEAHGTFKGFPCSITHRLHDHEDRAMVRVILRRSRAMWTRDGDTFYRGNCAITFVSDLGGWAPGSWARICEALGECHAFVSKPFTAEEAGLA